MPSLPEHLQSRLLQGRRVSHCTSGTDRGAVGIRPSSSNPYRDGARQAGNVPSGLRLRPSADTVEYVFLHVPHLRSPRRVVDGDYQRGSLHAKKPDMGRHSPPDGLLPPGGDCGNPASPATAYRLVQSRQGLPDLDRTRGISPSPARHEATPVTGGSLTIARQRNSLSPHRRTQSARR